MDAIKLLTQQHREIEACFQELAISDDEDERRELFEDIADELAIHAAIEERFFYPMVRERQTEEQVAESYDEHLEIKQRLIDAMDTLGEPGFAGRVAALRTAFERHVESEERELFAQVERMLPAAALEAIGEEMEAETEALAEEGGPRADVEDQKKGIEPPPIQP